MPDIDFLNDFLHWLQLALLDKSFGRYTVFERLVQLKFGREEIIFIFINAVTM